MRNESFGKQLTFSHLKSIASAEALAEACDLHWRLEEYIPDLELGAMLTRLARGRINELGQALAREKLPPEIDNTFRPHSRVVFAAAPSPAVVRFYADGPLIILDTYTILAFTNYL